MRIAPTFAGRTPRTISVLLTVLLGGTMLAAVIGVLRAPAQPVLAQGRIYVDADATGAYNGTSWTNAYTNVQDALSAAVSGDDIWVAEGIYYPDQGGGTTDDDPESTFRLVSGVSLYGGFAGTETLLAQRDWQAHVTVLSGDLDQNDTFDGNGVITDTDNISGTNAFHVLSASSAITESASLDGFTITAGDASGSGQPVVTVCGGGMHNSGDPTLINIAFSGNYAAFNGGGMYSEGDPALNNVTFGGNEANNVGGGIYSFQGNPTLANVSFVGNTAGFGAGMSNEQGSAILTDTIFDGNQAFTGDGGGMFNQTSVLTLTNVHFYSNQAGQSGGAVFHSGGSLVLTNGIVSNNRSSHYGGGFYGGRFTLTNVAFSSNRASAFGGAIYNKRNKLSLTNVVVSGNRARAYGAGIYNENTGNFELTNVTLAGNRSTYGASVYNLDTSAALTLTNCIVWDNSSRLTPNGHIVVNNSIVEGGHAGTGNLDVDPQFITPVDFTDAPTTTGNLRLQLGSPAIDQGDNTAVVVATDLDGNPRIVGSTVDMGAYEYTLGMGKTVSPDAGVAYQDIVTYTIRLENLGAVDETGVLLTDTLPVELDFEQWIEQPDEASESGDVIAWGGTLTAETAITFTFTAAYIGDVDDMVTNTATYSGSLAFTDSTTFAVGTPDLAISQVATPALAGPRQPITYTLIFTNIGVATATGVSITDAIPISVTDTSVISSSVAITQVEGTRYTWDIQDLEPGQGGIIVISGVLQDMLPSHTFTNTATIGTMAYEANLENNSASAGITLQAHYIFLPLVLRNWP